MEEAQRDEPHRTQAERRAETQRRIVEAAMRLIASRGSRSVSLADIGREAGYSRGIVTHMFGTKAQLLTALVIHAQHSFVVAEWDDGLDQLLATVESYLHHLRDQFPVGQAFLLLWSEAVADDPDLRPLYAERDKWFRAIIAEQVRRGRSQGSIRPGDDAAAVAYTIVGLLRGIGLQLMLTSEPDLYPAICAAAVETVRQGLAADSDRAIVDQEETT